MRTFRIYGLVDPRSNAIRYVGSTSKELSHRLGDHFSSHHGKAPRHRWIKELRDLSMRPRIELLEEVSATHRLDAYTIEQRWIRKLRNDGHDLLNKDADR